MTKYWEVTRRCHRILHRHFDRVPVLLIVIAIAGIVFGRDAAQSAISGQFSGAYGATDRGRIAVRGCECRGQVFKHYCDDNWCHNANRNGIRGIWRDASRPEFNL